MKRFLRLCVLAIAANYAVWGAGLTGIWMGEAPGRNGEKQDIAFQFKMTGEKLAGVMFGEEFDLPVEDLKLEGDKVSFAVTNINYYSGSRLTMVYRGTVTDKEIHLTRERKGGPAEGGREVKPQEVILKRVM
jgi:hypothetical protein